MDLTCGMTPSQMVDMYPRMDGLWFTKLRPTNSDTFKDNKRLENHWLLLNRTWWFQAQPANVVVRKWFISLLCSDRLRWCEQPLEISQTSLMYKYQINDTGNKKAKRYDKLTKREKRYMTLIREKSTSFENNGVLSIEVYKLMKG